MNTATTYCLCFLECGETSSAPPASAFFLERNLLFHYTLESLRALSTAAKKSLPCEPRLEDSEFLFTFRWRSRALVPQLWTSYSAVFCSAIFLVFVYICLPSSLGLLRDLLSLIPLRSSAETLAPGPTFTSYNGVRRYGPPFRCITLSVSCLPSPPCFDLGGRAVPRVGSLDSAGNRCFSIGGAALGGKLLGWPSPEFCLCPS